MRTILVGLLLAGSVAACSGPLTVFGYVRMEGGRGVMNVSVTLEMKTDEGYIPVNAMRTRKQGAYEFGLDPCEAYRLRFFSKKFDVTNLARVPFGDDRVEVDAEAWER